MPRPSTLPLAATSPTARTPPLAGVLTTGYGYGTPWAGKHAHWHLGFLGDWSQHLDETTVRLTDEWYDAGSVNLVRGTGLSFTVGGPLAQKPVTGGVYIGRNTRLDMSVFGADAPTFTFAPSTTNYVHVKASVGWSAYPDITVNTNPVPPTSFHRTVRVVTCNAVQITTDAAPISQLTGFAWRGPQKIVGTTTSTTLEINVSASSAPGAVISAQGGATNTMLQFAPNSGQINAEFSSLGLGTPATYTTCNLNSAGHRVQATALGSAAVAVATGGVAAGWALAMEPMFSAPPNDPGNPWGTWLRMYAVSEVAAGGLRYRDASGNEWTPHGGLGRILRQRTTAAGNPVIAAGAATTLHTLNVSGTIKQAHWYIITVDCEATNNSLATFTQSVSITVDGVAVAPWSAKNIIADRDNLTKPWLSATLIYQHTGADVVNPAIALAITHGAGASSCQYHAARIGILGGWYDG